jgi:hypothetical protein
MDIRVTHFCLLTEFLDVDFNAKEISDGLTPRIKAMMHENNLTIPSDWILIFQASYNNGKQPLVSRNKVGSYTSDRMKYVTIAIPVPLKTEISWGVNPDQHLYKKDHYDKLMKNFYELDVDYKDYTNRTDYIIACLNAGIKRSFEEGFTVGGIKVKAKISVF